MLAKYSMYFILSVGFGILFYVGVSNRIYQKYCKVKDKIRSKEKERDKLQNLIDKNTRKSLK